MEDRRIETSEHYGNHRGHYTGHLSPEPRNTSVKFSSIEERNDSGLGSLGYSSLDYCGSLPLQEEEENAAKANSGIPIHPDRVRDSGSNSTLSSDLENSLSRLNIGSIENKLEEQCDSGVDRDSLLAAQTYLTQNLHWVSPHFTPDQIVEIFRGDEDGDNHLHLSIIHNLPELTMQIIGLAPSHDWLNQTNNMQQTPLHIAVLTHQVQVVRRLVCAGAYVGVRDQMGNTPLHSACVLGYEDIVQELLTPVRAEETYQNKYEIPYQRIPQDLEMNNYEGLTCLHLSAISGHMNIMQRLLCSGANINVAEGKSGRTILHFAADWGNIRMASFLLSYRDADIDARTYSGLTPIFLAWGRKHIELANLLYSKGASVEGLNEDSDADASDEEMCNEVCTLPAQTQRQIQPVR